MRFWVFLDSVSLQKIYESTAGRAVPFLQLLAVFALWWQSGQQGSFLGLSRRITQPEYWETQWRGFWQHVAGGDDQHHFTGTNFKNKLSWECHTQRYKLCLTDNWTDKNWELDGGGDTAYSNLGHLRPNFIKNICFPKPSLRALTSTN